MRNALEGIRVIEIGKGLDVRYAGKLFAGIGAKVTSIRHTRGLSQAEASDQTCDNGDANTDYLDVAKNELCVNVASSDDLGRLHRLIELADIVLHGWPSAPSVFDTARLREINRRAVIVEIGKFGPVSGFANRPSDELTLQAMGAISLGIGTQGRPPLRLPGEQTAFQAGLCAAIAAMGQLSSAEGCLIDIAGVDIWATIYNGGEVANNYFGRKRKPRAGYRVSRQPYLRAIFPCNDGYFSIQCSETRHWSAFLAMVDREDLADHPLFANRLKANDENAEECDALFAPWFADRSKQVLLDLCLRHKIPGAPVYTAQEVAEHPHLRDRDYFRPADINGKQLPIPTDPFRIDCSFTRSPADARSQIDDGKAQRSAATATPRDATSECKRPLDGVRVIDFGWVWAGAIPGHVLADLGAEVIRIEGRKPLDFMRQGRPLFGTDKDPEQNPVFQNVNRGKLSVCLDLNQADAAQIARELVAKCDVVIENFSPGVMSRFGMAWKDLHIVNPNLIMCSMSAVGQSGPLQGIRTYAAMIASLAGMNSMVGYSGERVLGVQAPPFADPNAGLHAAFAILAALYERRTNGMGCYIDLSQWEAAANTMGPQIMDYVMNRTVAGTRGAGNGIDAPYGHFPVNGDDKWIAIAVHNEKQWVALMRALGSPAWMQEDRFNTRSSRIANMAELDELLSAETGRRDGDQLARDLRAADVPAEVLLDIGELLEHPYFRDRQLYEMVEHPVLQRVPVYRLPWHIDGQPLSIVRRAPLLGEHTDQILRDLLGKRESEIAALRDRQVIY